MCSQVVMNRSHIDGETTLSSGPQELSLTEQEQVNGGLVPALIGAFIIRRYGGTIAATAAGAVAGWFSE